MSAAVSQNVSDHVFLWSQLSCVWAIISYGISSDQLRNHSNNSDSTKWAYWQAWIIHIALRAILGAALAYVLTRSAEVSGVMVIIIIIHPIARIATPAQFSALVEVGILLGFECGSLFLIRHRGIPLRFAASNVPLTRSHFTALMLLTGLLVFVVRGGTYVVRGCLSTVGALPLRQAPQGNDGDEVVDEVEVNRGRLIGILERLLLTLVVAAGSYAALGFLIAAKGLIRSDDLQRREFAEYFLVGSLASVLIALCAGLALRYLLLALWPELLSLQMQS